MLLSMTGYGESHRQQNGLAVAVEVRTINNRYFKLSIRAAEGYSTLEPQLEAVIRTQIKRGTVQLGLRVDREPSPDDYRLNRTVLESYRRQLEQLDPGSRLAEPVRLETLLSLPGVVNERAWQSVNAEQDWPVIEAALTEALAHLAQMRIDEGRAMAADLSANCRVIGEQLNLIATRAPHVAEGYRGRLAERMNKLLVEHGVSVSTTDLIREVSLFAERCDISEEVVRLKSHLEQFDTILAAEESSGRKLEFLIQEMFREANTIGSKANDSEISLHVIEIKSAIERMREMIQNAE